MRITLLSGIFWSLISLHASGQETKPPAKKKESGDGPYLTTSYRYPIIKNWEKLENVQSYSGVALSLSPFLFMPTGSFATVSETKYMPGVHLGVDYQPKEKWPMTVGFDLGIAYTGYEVQRMTIRLPLYVGNRPIDNLEVPIEGRFESKFFPLVLHSEFWLPTKSIQPFGAVYAGLNYFVTTSKLIDRSLNGVFSKEDSREIIWQIDASRITWTAGIGGGLRVNLVGNLDVDLGAKYLYGGIVSYYDGGDLRKWLVEYVGDEADYERGNPNPENIRTTTTMKRSSTDMVQYFIRFLARM